MDTFLFSSFRIIDRAPSRLPTETGKGIWERLTLWGGSGPRWFWNNMTQLSLSVIFDFFYLYILNPRIS
jgi:hypothetical protein